MYFIMKKVLVLMSTYNGASYIREQITTLLNQKKVDVLLLIRDDGSTDSTIDIIKDICKDHNNIKFIKGENRGCPQSFLSLMEATQTIVADYDYIAFSDQDDIWLPEKLYQASLKIQDLPQDAPALYFSNLYITRGDYSQRSLMYESAPPINKSHLMVENFAAGCTIMFNKMALTTFLKLPVNNLIMHDKRLIHMCMLLGNIIYDSNAYICYRQHEDNVIGANYYFKQRINSKLRSLKNFWKQHDREEEAKEVLAAYGELMTDEDRKMVSIVAFYRKRIKYRLLMLFSPGKYDFNMRRHTDNFWFKIRVLIGAV